MTKDTATFLLGLVNGLTINVGAPDFEEALAKVIAARTELAALLRDEPTTA